MSASRLGAGKTERNFGRRDSLPADSAHPFDPDVAVGIGCVIIAMFVVEFL